MFRATKTCSGSQILKKNQKILSRHHSRALTRSSSSFQKRIHPQHYWGASTTQFNLSFGRSIDHHCYSDLVTSLSSRQSQQQQQRNISTFVFKEEDDEEMSELYKRNDLVFNLTAEQIEKETTALIEKSKAVHDAVANLPESERTFESVILPIAYDEAYCSIQENNLTFPSYVSPNKEVRDAGSNAEERLSEFTIEVLMREDVYRAVKYVHEKMQKELDKYDEEDKRLVKRILRDYERNGLGLPEEKRSKVKELKNTLSKLCIQFTKNIAEDKTVLTFTKEELSGVPEDVINNYKTSEEDPNKRVVTLKYPDAMPIMKYCKVEETRRKLEIARASQCQEINVPLFEQAVKIRQQIAELMGYKTHADYVLEVNMATPDEVLTFLNNLKEKLIPGGKQELQTLKEMKGSEVYSWDYLYLLTKLKEEKYNVDDNLIKEYFPLDVTLNGLLSIAQETFSLRFEEVKDTPVWYEDVKLYAVFDKETDAFLGQWYIDSFPREGKYSHFAAFPLSPHFYDEHKKEHYPVSAMVCNFTKPSAETGVSLLKHDEVITLLHEFGHLCHGFLSRTKYARFSGTRVERDFVEMPSQFWENFGWEKEGLKKLSSHYKTKEPLPDDLIEKMIAAKNVGVALFNLRQLFFGIFDMTCHTLSTSEEAEKLNSGELWRKLRREVTLLDAPEGTNGAGSFGHLMGGYDSGYYGYLYSEVFSTDMFSVFKKTGIFNPETGKKLRRVVLERGGSKDGGDMLREFLGREPSQDAFLEDIGLLKR
ncbi:hypothetical protein FDP41_012678 [Naegleria fowleri]|uniref:Peptidase M3A/M3B catalytic domain-containing protein n=1 Tax=Naegleria fowleri TaxID=5763 RepID=A0A6A5C4U4_NAEFO|nr:uncharacterized protein FDP41_012678 [Naegleria fowleri]KAF0980890.1 hypothetical protein FDP41_012678 [Naegleria fowleri]CAG4717215.1 unnamed protein product [Naegleria fowleri]